MSDYSGLNKDADEYYRALLATGWIDEWDDEEMALLQQELKKIAEQSAEHIVFALSEYVIDPESITKADDYRNLLLDMFSTFGLDLLPTDVSVEEDGDTLVFDVITPDGDVTFEITADDDWMSDEFLDIINDDLLPQWGQERIFHILPPAEAKLDIVFQYPDVIDAAIDAGVLPDDEYFMG